MAKENLLPPHGLLFLISSEVSFICTIPIDRITYHGLCYTSRGALAGMRNSSMGPPHEGSIRRPIAPRANSLGGRKQEDFKKDNTKTGTI